VQSAISGMGRVVSNPSQSPVKTGYQRPATPADIAFVADDMRPEDVAEVKAQSGATPRDALLYCLLKSKPCMAMVGRHGSVVGVWGVIPENETAGRVWMLGRQAMLDDAGDRRTFLRQSRIELAKLQAQYPVLFNVVDARNEVHVRWLRYMGFTFICKHPNWGPEGRLFYEFVRV